MTSRSHHSHGRDNGQAQQPRHGQNSQVRSYAAHSSPQSSYHQRVAHEVAYSQPHSSATGRYPDPYQLEADINRPINYDQQGRMFQSHRYHDGVLRGWITVNKEVYRAMDHPSLSDGQGEGHPRPKHRAQEHSSTSSLKNWASESEREQPWNGVYSVPHWSDYDIPRKQKRKKAHQAA